MKDIKYVIEIGKHRIQKNLCSIDFRATVSFVSGKTAVDWEMKDITHASLYDMITTSQNVSLSDIYQDTIVIGMGNGMTISVWDK